MSFFQIAAGVSALVNSGVGAYVAIETLDIAKDQAEFNNKLAETKANLEADLIATQKRIFEIQAEGISARNEIDLRIAESQAEAITRQLKRSDELAQMQLELSKIGMATDYNYAIIELQKVKELQETHDQKKITESIQSAESIQPMESIQPVESTIPKLAIFAIAGGLVTWLFFRTKE